MDHVEVFILQLIEQRAEFESFLRLHESRAQDHRSVRSRERRCVDADGLPVRGGILSAGRLSTIERVGSRVDAAIGERWKGLASAQKNPREQEDHVAHIDRRAVVDIGSAAAGHGASDEQKVDDGDGVADIDAGVAVDFASQERWQRIVQ